MANGDLATLAADLSRLAASAAPQAKTIITKVAFDVEASMKANIQRHGLVDTGFMLGSVGTDPPTLRELEAIIGPTAHYAPYHEYGTATIPPRPFAGPAADQHEDAFVRAMLSIGADIL